MLVLSRKPSEEIVIGGNIVLKVLRVQGNRVYLGIEAPDDVVIRRGELGAESQRQPEHETIPVSVPCPAASV